MMTPLLAEAGLGRTHHDGMLILKLRPSMARFRSATVSASTSMETPGISAMATLERRGLIKRVTPLSRESHEHPPSTVPGLRVASMLGAMAPESGRAPAHSGSCIVEFEPEVDLASLQNSLVFDPDIEFAAKVPIRYVLAEKRGRKSGAKSASPAAVPPSSMWNLDKIKWAEARSASGFVDANEIKVAVLDTGIQENHPDLVGVVEKYSYLFPEIQAPSGPEDIVGHGTHVAGTIAARINNDTGIQGICNCRLMIWKIFDDEEDYKRGVTGIGEYVYYVNPIMYRRALAECIDEGVQVVNLSIGGGGAPDPFERELFDTLLANQVAVVAAMGNSRRIGSPTSYPAAIPGVIAVGATNIDDQVASFSSRGPHIAISAPGVGIWSTLPTYPGQFGFDAVRHPDGSIVPGNPRRRETHYDAWPGTSMATPHVAAAAALLLAKRGAMSAANVKAHLTASADRVAGMGGGTFHQDYGAGRLNLARLLSGQ